MTRQEMLDKAQALIDEGNFDLSFSQTIHLLPSVSAKNIPFFINYKFKMRKRQRHRQI